MNALQVSEIGLKALLMALILCGPILLAVLLVGLAIGIVQAATSVNETAVAFVPKLIAIAIILFLMYPFITDYFVDYIRTLITTIPGYFK